MTKKTLEAASKAKAAAKRAKEKLAKLATLHAEEEANKLAVDAARDAKEAEDAATEVEAEAQRRLELEDRIQKEDPSLWEKFKKWF